MTSLALVHQPPSDDQGRARRARALARRAERRREAAEEQARARAMARHPSFRGRAEGTRDPGHLSLVR